MSVEKDLICIVCPVGCRLKITKDEGATYEAINVENASSAFRESLALTIDELKVSGEQCKRGIAYAYEEITNPTRMVCTTVKIQGGIHPVIPVRTDKPIPEKYKFEVVKAVKDITLTSPIEMGEVIVEDLFGTGVNLIAERNM